MKKLINFFKNWLTHIFLPHHISDFYLGVVAVSGREPIEPLPPINGYHHFSLTGVTVDWYHRYVKDCKVELDSKAIDVVHDVLKGRPKDFVEYVKAKRLQGVGQ